MTIGLPFALLCALLVAILGSACSKNQATAPRNVYQIPWPTEAGDYRIQEVTIESFDQPEAFQGHWAKILVNPYVADGVLQSSQPVGRFIRTGSQVAVPADFITLQATALYAHIERLQVLDAQVGVADRIQWPLKIGLQANVVDRESSERTGRPEALLNNAIYEGRLDALLFVPYLDARLPITLNAGILAHEHFHKIFQTLVIDRLPMLRVAGGGPAAKAEWLPEEPRREDGREDGRTTTADEPIEPATTQEKDPVTADLYNQFLLRGLNEGLADFWGWVYTGDPSFIGHSLRDGENELRRLDRSVVPLWTIEKCKGELRNPGRPQELRRDDDRYTAAYRLGTHYARFMRRLALEISGGDEKDPRARMIVARSLINALPMIGDVFAKALAARVPEKVVEKSAEQNIEKNVEKSVEKNGVFIEPSSLLKPLYLHLPDVNEAACGLFDEFLGHRDSAAKPGPCQKKGEAPK